MYDYVIIGAGVIGSAVARELSKYQVKVLCIEKENDVANVQSLANSAIIHAGHNPIPGSLKALLSVKGNHMYHQWESDLDIPLLNLGAYVVAHNKEEEKRLESYVENCRKNGVPEYMLLSGDEAREEEPHLAKSISKVLFLPTTKVTYPWEVAFACMENAIENGVEWMKNHEVVAIQPKENHFAITLKCQEVIETKHVINAAGVNADDIGAMIETPPFKVRGRKGEYFVLDKRVKGFMNKVIYPLPSDKGKGVLMTPQYHGEILLGPSSEFVTDKHRANTTITGLEYVKKNASLLADDIPFDDIIRSFAGIRSTSDYHDFYIKESTNHHGFYYLGGIESPGLTAAPAIASYLVEEVMRVNKQFSPNPNFQPKRRKQKAFTHLPMNIKKKLIKKDKRYGHIVCKCEGVTEKEIIDAIHGPLGSSTIKGIKKRVRAGAGRCQGGYCEDKIVKIIARECGVSPLNVGYDREDSPLFFNETKVKK